MKQAINYFLTRCPSQRASARCDGQLAGFVAGRRAAATASSGAELRRAASQASSTKVLFLRAEGGATIRVNVVS